MSQTTRDDLVNLVSSYFSGSKPDILQIDEKSGSRTVRGSHAPIQRVQLLHMGTQLPRGHLLHEKSGLHTAQIFESRAQANGEKPKPGKEKREKCISRC